MRAPTRPVGSEGTFAKPCVLDAGEITANDNTNPGDQNLVNTACDPRLGTTLQPCAGDSRAFTAISLRRTARARHPGALSR